MARRRASYRGTRRSTRTARTRARNVRRGATLRMRSSRRTVGRRAYRYGGRAQKAADTNLVGIDRLATEAMRSINAGKIKRTVGVTVMSIVSWVGAFISISSGLLILSLASVGSFLPGLGVTIQAAGVAVGAILALIGIATAIATYWFWRFQKRGWSLLMATLGLQVIFGILAGSFLSAVLSAIVMVYAWSRRRNFRIKI